MFMKKVSDMRIVMQRVSFSPESGGVWKPKITCAAIFVVDGDLSNAELFRVEGVLQRYI